MSEAFASLLKHWRTRRRLSQLDLALAANVSARHLSFLETARARPSRAMVLQLSQAMQVPRPERNALLEAAGFAAAYRTRRVDAPDLAFVREAVAWTLARHDPYPALVLDRHWQVLESNRCATELLKRFGLAIGDSLLDAFIVTGGFRNALANWPTMAQQLLPRLRNESAHLGGDAVLDAAASALQRELGEQAPAAEPAYPAVIPVVFDIACTRWSLFSSIAQFSSAEDIALAELKLELMFPADEATRQSLLGAAPQTAQSR
jgi:transcriptional regulator with XRE-family HTH domain